MELSLAPPRLLNKKLIDLALDTRIAIFIYPVSKQASCKHHKFSVQINVQGGSIKGGHFISLFCYFTLRNVFYEKKRHSMIQMVSNEEIKSPETKSFLSFFFFFFYAKQHVLSSLLHFWCFTTASKAGADLNRASEASSQRKIKRLTLAETPCSI